MSEIDLWNATRKRGISGSDAWKKNQPFQVGGFELGKTELLQWKPGWFSYATLKQLCPSLCPDMSSVPKSLERKSDVLWNDRWITCNHLCWLVNMQENHPFSASNIFGSCHMDNTFRCVDSIKSMCLIFSGSTCFYDLCCVVNRWRKETFWLQHGGPIRFETSILFCCLEATN